MLLQEKGEHVSYMIRIAAQEPTLPGGAGGGRGEHWYEKFLNNNLIVYIGPNGALSGASNPYRPTGATVRMYERTLNSSFASCKNKILHLGSHHQLQGGWENNLRQLVRNKHTANMTPCRTNAMRE